MARRPRRWARILGLTLLVVVGLVFLLWLRAHRESEGLAHLPSDETFANTTPYRLKSLRELSPSLPDGVNELGRVAWEGRGVPIAFDAKDSADAKFDVYTVDADGGNVSCLSCSIPWLDRRNVGNPAYDPTGRWLLVQIENEEPVHGEIALPVLVADPSYPGFGISSSLWVYDVEEEKFHPLFEVNGENGIGTLHPHFSEDGQRVTWARIVGSQGCMGDMEIMVADFRTLPTPHLENIRALAADTAPEQRFFETQDFREDEILAACTPEEGQAHHFMDLCLVDPETGALERVTRHSGVAGEQGSWEEHAKFIDPDTLLFVSSRGYPSPIKACDIASASFMKWLKTDLYLKDLSRPEVDWERLTFFNEPGHEMACDCTNALASDFSWNEAEHSAVVFVQYLNWPRYLPIPIGFKARYFIVELERET